MNFKTCPLQFFFFRKRFLGPRSLALLIFVFFLVFGTSALAQNRPLGAVATQHPLATETAAKILRKGGNAVDGAVAAALTLAVVEPYYSGLGAGGMALFWDGREKKIHAFDFREKAPLAATAEMFLKVGVPSDASENGPLAIAIPGEIHGLATLHRGGGRLAWSELFSDAIKLAESGFVPDPILIQHAANKKECLRRDYDSAQIYQGLWSSARSVSWRQPALAETMKRLAAEGPEVFYRGPLGSSLVADLQGKGALITAQDLAEYQTIERESLSAKFSFGKLWGFPLPSSGGISILRGLQTMEELGEMNKKKSSTGDWIAWMLGVLGQIFETRNTEMGDSDFVKDLPVKKWISKGHAKDEAKKNLAAPPVVSIPSSLKSLDGQTTHLSVIDAEGNAVAMTLTQNLSFGSCVTSGQTGITMNNQMDDFSTRPGQPNFFGLVQSEANAIAPGKRPLSSMSPTLLTEKEEVVLVLGTRGGPRIISTLLEVLYRRFFLGETLAAAIAARRFHYQVSPNKVEVERKGDTWCDVQAVGVDPRSRTYFALSDPRGQGKAVVVFPKRVPTGE